MTWRWDSNGGMKTQECRGQTEEYVKQPL